MEVRVRERLIGALVLVAIVVLLVPAVLKGRGTGPVQPPGAQSRRVEVPIGDGKAQPDEQGLVPEPSLPGAMPQAAPDEIPPAPATAEPIDRETPPPPVRQEAAAQKPEPSPAAGAVTEPPPPSRAATVPSPPAAKASPPAQSAWAVQLGAYASREKAEQFVADLKKRGFAAFVLEYRASGKVLYRVRVGPEQERARAEAIAARLAKDGYQTVVARHP